MCRRKFMDNIIVETGTALYPIYFTDDFSGLARLPKNAGIKEGSSASFPMGTWRPYMSRP